MRRNGHRDVVILLRMLILVLDFIRRCVVGCGLRQLHLRRILNCTLLVRNALVELGALLLLNLLLTRHSVLIIGRGLLLPTTLRFHRQIVRRELLRARL